MEDVSSPGSTSISGNDTNVDMAVPEPLNVALIGGLFGGLSLLLLVIGTLVLVWWLRKKKPHPHDDAAQSNQYEQVSEVQLRSNVYSSAPALQNNDISQYDQPETPLTPKSNQYDQAGSALN